MTPRHTALLAGLLAGVTLLALGFAAGLTLPAARAGELPPRARFLERFRTTVQQHGITTVGRGPRVRLVTPNDEIRVVRRLLGEAAHDWLARHRRGLMVEVSQAAQWEGATG